MLAMRNAKLAASRVAEKAKDPVAFEKKMVKRKIVLIVFYFD